MPADGALYIASGPQPGLIPADGALFIASGPQPGLIPSDGALFIASGTGPPNWLGLGVRVSGYGRGEGVHIEHIFPPKKVIASRPFG